MGENRLKEPIVKEAKRSKNSVFSLIDNNMKMESAFGNGLPVKYIPYILYITFLGVLYIANIHFSDRMNRRIVELRKVVEDLKSDHTTMKANNMKDSKLSSVAEKVEEMGLKEANTSPQIIIVEEKSE